ncbi:MAG: M23 family metallopeptidase [Microbacteriaceae bacterium]
MNSSEGLSTDDALVDRATKPRSRRVLRTSSSFEPGNEHAPETPPRITPRVAPNPEHRVRATLARQISRTTKPLAKWGSSIARAGAAVVAALFVIGLTVPANAFLSPQVMLFAESNSDEGQSVITAEGEVAEVIRTGDYSVLSFGEMLTLKYGSLNFEYSTDWVGPVRWPFPVPVPISSGFGARTAPCFVCSTDHKGLDFTPGEGTPIFAVADGVVAESHVDQWGFGTWVRITHNINGTTVDTVYAHMQRGSTTLEVGDVVKVADLVGTVGNTGTSTGAHLHLEVHVDGVVVDPFIWLGENTKKSKN